MNTPTPPRTGFRLWNFLRDRTFRSLRHRNYRLYFYGQLVSFIGSWVQSTALMWLVYDLTNDTMWPGLMLVAQVGPTLLLGPVGGAIADRLPNRRVVTATQVAFLTNAIVLTICVASSLTSPVLLLMFQLCSGIIQAFDLPARLAFVPDLVPKVDLVNAVGLNSLLFNAARAVGPAIAGGFFLLASELIAAGYLPGSRVSELGAVWCLSINALSYGAVLIALMRIDVGNHPRRGASGPGRSFWTGLGFLRANPALAGLLLTTGIFSGFAWPILTLAPSYTRLVLHQAERTYSLLLSSFGIGALVGALGAASFGTIARRGPMLVLGMALGLVGLVGLSLVQTFGAAVGCCMVMGVGMVVYLSTGQSTMQTSAPDSARGKVMALWAMMLSASSLPGHLILGREARTVPIANLLFIMAAGVAVALVCLLLFVRRLAPKADLAK